MTSTEAANAAFDGRVTFDLYSGKFYDFTIRCQGKEWKVHRVIVCTASKFFDRACEETFQEGKSREINLQEDQPAYVEEVLRFLYTGDYKDEPFKAHPAEANVHIYALADKYDIKTLKQQARNKFAKSIAYLEYDNNDLVTEIVEAIYTTTPFSDRGLRDAVAPLLKDCKSALRAHDAFVELIRNKLGGDFALDVIDAWTGKKASGSSSEATSSPSVARCPRCKSNAMCCNHCLVPKEWVYGSGLDICSGCQTTCSAFCSRCDYWVDLEDMN